LNTERSSEYARAGELMSPMSNRKTALSRLRSGCLPARVRIARFACPPKVSCVVSAPGTEVASAQWSSSQRALTSVSACRTAGPGRDIERGTPGDA
jgi:hypothetical protein